MLSEAHNSEEENKMIPKYLADIEKLNTVDNIQDMRIEIQRISRYNSVVNACISTAYHRGLSGEDLYTYMAYQLLKQNIEYYSQALESAMSKTL